MSYIDSDEKEKIIDNYYEEIIKYLPEEHVVVLNDETIKGEDKVKEILNKYNKKPIFIRDRGYDANEFFKKDINEDNKFVTRLKENRHLLFKGKKRLVEEVARSRKGKISTKLMYRGENKECSISYTRVQLPVCNEKDINLVTIHGLSEEGTMMLLTKIKRLQNI